ncbi:MAG: hypothetical protein V2A79_00980 [Planctomycetota bacterium]
MMRNSAARIIAIVVLCGACGAVYGSVQPADPPVASAPPAMKPVGATDQPATQPAEGQDLSAEVIEVRGVVERSTVAAGSADPAAVKWAPVQQGEKLGGGTQIRTGLRAHVILRFGDNTVVMIKRSTLAGIEQFYREANTETIRLGLGYGAVRGGTSEGPVRSDFVVDSTVATLAKRGTEGWEFWVEPYTGRFRVSLAESGLVEALEKLTDQRRLVRPHEYADHSNIGAMWVKQDIFNRAVQFFTAETITPSDSDFSVDNPGGFGALGPGLGSETRGFSGRRGGGLAPGAPDSSGVRQRLLDTLVLRPSFVVRPEGNFGLGPTFDVLVPETQRKAFHPASHVGTGLRTRHP